jgi:integrase
MGTMRTAAGELFKQRITCYLDAGGRRVKPDTPGARKVVEESRKWYGRAQDPADGTWRLVPLSRDKQSARKKLADLETKLARGEAGLVDPHEETKSASLPVLVGEYVADLAQTGKSERYREQTRREALAVVAGCGAERLCDLTVARVNRFLAGLKCSARNKNCYRRSVIGLCNFLVGKDRLAANPLLKTTRAKEKKGEERRKRRALKAGELQALLHAARRRPLEEAMTVRRGPRRGNCWPAFPTGSGRGWSGPAATAPSST